MLTNPNALLAGVIGTGKSALAKSLATRSLAFGIRVYVPGDPKGEWTAVTRAVGGTAITLGQGQPTRLNPLDEGRRPAGLTDQQGDAAIAKIILGGGSNARDLADLATLIGERDDHTLAVSRGSYGEKSTRSKPRTMSNCSRRCCSSAPSSSS